MSSADSHQQFMRAALALAKQSVDEGGGPFGAVIVYEGKIIARGNNRVTASNDPTAHAEILTIREAGQALGRFVLSGCELYVSCEPCPMCLAAAYWARLDRIFYAATREEAAAAGFDDALIYQEVCLPSDRRCLPMHQYLQAEASEPFIAWEAKQDRVDY
jgi:tRNA(Arg) A34 adenosine deaminase TadA